MRKKHTNIIYDTPICHIGILGFFSERKKCAWPFVCFASCQGQLQLKLHDWPIGKKLIYLKTMFSEIV
jgi:hypothetical protein